MRNALVVSLLLIASPALALSWVLKLDGVPAEFTVGVDGAQLSTLSYGARAAPGAKAALGAFVDGVRCERFLTGTLNRAAEVSWAVDTISGTSVAGELGPYAVRCVR